MMVVAVQSPSLQAAGSPLTEQRCRACRKLLCKADGRGRVEVVCPKCGEMNQLPRD